MNVSEKRSYHVLKLQILYLKFTKTLIKNKNSTVKIATHTRLSFRYILCKRASNTVH